MVRPSTSNIMEYVRWLEDCVRDYKTKDYRFTVKWFAVGFVAGAAVMSVLAVMGVLR